MKPIRLIVLIGTLCTLLFSSGQVENPDTHLRLSSAYRLIETGKIAIPNDTGELSHGNISINQNGERHMVYNLGQTLVFIPISIISKICFLSDTKQYLFATFIVSFINYIVLTIIGVYVYLLGFALKQSKSSALHLAILTITGSYLFSSAQSTYEHHYETLALIASIYHMTRKQKRDLFYSGLWISFGLMFRTSTLLVLPAVLIFQKELKSMHSYILGILPGITLLLVYNYIRFESPFDTGYSNAWTLAFPNESPHWNLNNAPTNFAKLLFSPGKGLLFFSTSMILTIPFYRKIYICNRRFTSMIFVIVLTYTIFLCSNFAWHGSVWAFGPRYFTPIIPLLYLPFVFSQSKTYRKICIVLGITSQLVFTTVNPKRHVLSTYISSQNFQDNDLLNGANNIPYIFQIKQFNEVMNNPHKLHNMYPTGIWKKETRMGTDLEVLQTSIEKNSINYWYFRLYTLLTNE